MGARERGLTGVWRGLYSYPREFASADFLATLIDAGVTFSGMAEETGVDRSRRPIALGATIDGEREGSAVSFRKTYDGAGGWTHTVFYEGRINGDATEIEGRWNIPGVWSGKFMMIREKGVAEDIRERVEAKV